MGRICFVIVVAQSLYDSYMCTVTRRLDLLQYCSAAAVTSSSRVSFRPVKSLNPFLVSSLSGVRGKADATDVKEMLPPPSLIVL